MKGGDIINSLSDEVWIENNGYKISNKGKITKKNKDELQKMSVTQHGYNNCNAVFEDGFIVRSVHRAVAYVFLGKPKEGQEVNHIDGNKQNNCVENLEWVTKKENQQHEAKILQKRDGENCYMSKLTDEEVIEIYALCKDGNLMYKDIASKYNTSPSTVSLISCGRRWKYLNLEPLTPIRNKKYRL